MINLKLDIPVNVLTIIEVLNKSGYEAYVVGGCVRDIILGYDPEDWDITTSARPEAVKALFDKTIDTGIKHGTVIVMMNEKRYEITTYRIDGEYSDSRRPDNVKFAASIAEDLGRRDFNMNAIAYHPKKGLIDPFKGVEDIKKRRIATVGKAQERFHEDALRMLRAVRFSAQLDFTIDNDAFDSIRTNSYLIKKISFERIRDELNKLLTSNHPEKFLLLRETGLLLYIIPEFMPCFSTNQNNPYHVYNVAEHTLKALCSIEGSLVLRWTMLLHDIGKTVTRTTDEEGIDHFYGHEKESVKIAERILNRLRFDKKTITNILRLIKHHDRNIEPDIKSVRRAVSRVGEDIFEDLLKVKRADNIAQNPVYLRGRLERLGQVETLFKKILNNNECLDKKRLAINGHDLINIGYIQGKEIKRVLDRLLEIVLENPEINTREKLLQKAGEWLQKGL